MKTKLVLHLLLLLYGYTGYSYTYMNYRDPQGWKSGTGSIDTAVLSIKPKGAYLEYGFYLTFSTKPSTYPVSDTFEVSLYFDLPANAIVHDSWLWIGNYISRAELMDRNRANMIYESIVQRRQDPSILYKNSATQYELRVFPMAGNEQRKVKITYMVPVSFTSLSVMCPLPVNIVSASEVKPVLQLLCYEENGWTNPGVSEIPSLSFQSQPTGYKKAQIPPSLYQNTTLNYTLTSPMANSTYVSYYPTSATDGYYQLAVNPKNFLPPSPPKNVLMCFDHEPGLSDYTTNQILTMAQTMALQYLQPYDSFNLMFTQLSIKSASQDWIAASSQNITSTFAVPLATNPISNYTNIPSLLSTAIQFIQAHGNKGEIVLFANTDNQAGNQTANQLITDLMALRGNSNIKINIIEYTTKGYTYQWIGNQGYYGNQYFNENICALTGGNYQRTLVGYNYPYTNGQTLSDASNKVFKSMSGSLMLFDAHVTANGGFCYGRYNNMSSTTLDAVGTYIEVGKYHGVPSFEVEMTGIYWGVPFQQTVAVANPYAEDSLLRKIWAGMFIEENERLNPYPDNIAKNNIRDTSLSARVLSLYTAFLALEYADTSAYCSACEDETNTGGTVDVTDLQDSTLVTAFPNPFAADVNIHIRSREAVAEVQVQITDLQGRVVYHTTLHDVTETTLTWRGEGADGLPLSNGIYLASVKTQSSARVVKLIKQ